MFEDAQGEVAQKLRQKYKMIMVTNACDSRCGGCSSFCPNLHPDQRYSITIPDLRRDIELHAGRETYIAIYGGEPLIHPQWMEILDTLYSYPQISFGVFTKYDRHPADRNVYYFVDPKDPKDQECERFFYPQLVAPIDVFRKPHRRWYVKKAFKDCWVWQNCYSVVYGDRAYFCECAGMMDILFDEDHGWPVEPGVYPYDRTDREIAKQAKYYCYRCGCLYRSDELESFGVPDQYIRDKTLASATCRRSMRQPWRHIQAWDPPN